MTKLKTPKLKTHRGAAKRFKRTASGRIKFRRRDRNHILTKEKSKVKRKRKAMGLLAMADARLINVLLGKIKRKRKDPVIILDLDQTATQETADKA